MVTVETITEKIRMLPINSQREVFDFVDNLLEKSAKTNSAEQAAAWEDWANSHRQNTVIPDDRREIIYEDD